MEPSPKPRCVDSRQRGDLRYRTYRLSDGRRVRTIEVPATVLKDIASRARLNEALATWKRGEAARARTHARTTAVQNMLAQGRRPTHIANELGITEARVRQIRDAARRNEKPTNLWSIW